MSADRQRNSTHICHYHNLFVFFFETPVHKEKFYTFPYRYMFSHLKPNVRVFVINYMCKLWFGEKLNTELKADINTTAAVQSVAALMLSKYFLNDWPAHMLNKHKVFSSYIWRPAQPQPLLWSDKCAILVERYLLRL